MVTFGLQTIGQLCSGLVLLSILSQSMARSYRKNGYKYDTLLNPISRVYFQHQRNTAARSVIPVLEAIDLAVLKEKPVAHTHKVEIAQPNEAFGMNRIHKLQDPDLHAFRVDLIQMTPATTEMPTMRKTMQRILHRMRY